MKISGPGTAWGPLAMGVLSGEYERTPQGGKGNGLLVKVTGAPGTRTVH